MAFSFVVYIIGKEKGISATRPEKKPKEAAAGDAAAPKDDGLKKLLLSKIFIAGTICTLCNLAQGMTYNTYIIAYLTYARGFELTSAAAIVGSSFLVAVLSGPSAGAFSDFVKNRKITLAIGVVINIICLFIIMTTNSLALIVFIVPFRLFFSTWVANSITSALVRHTAGPYNARAMGLNSGMGHIGSITFPLLLGFILDATNRNYNFLFWIIIILIGIIGFIGLFIMPSDKVAPKKKD